MRERRTFSAQREKGKNGAVRLPASKFQSLLSTKWKPKDGGEGIFCSHLTRTEEKVKGSPTSRRESRMTGTTLSWRGLVDAHSSTRSRRLGWIGQKESEVKVEERKWSLVEFMRRNNEILCTLHNSFYCPLLSNSEFIFFRVSYP